MKTTSTLLIAALFAGVPLTACKQHAHGQPPATPAKAGPAPAAVAVKGEPRTVELTVTSDGFVPAEVKAKRGETLRLAVTRKTDQTCATEIVIKDHGVNQALPLDKTVFVELTPNQPGNVRYACGMDMIAGVIVVE